MVENWAAAIAALLASVIIPFAVNLCAGSGWSSNAKRWVALAVSLAMGVLTGIAAGIPTPETLATWALGAVGATQIAYGAFKAIGITDTWLDALLNVGKKDE